MLEVTYIKLSEELENLKAHERGKIATIIDEARAQSDLKNILGQVFAIYLFITTPIKYTNI